MINVNNPEYTPIRLLNYVSDRLGVSNQKGLCIALDVDDATISKVFNRKQPISKNLMIAILDNIPEMSIAQLRELAGMQKGK